MVDMIDIFILLTLISTPSSKFHFLIVPSSELLNTCKDIHVSSFQLSHKKSEYSALLVNITEDFMNCEGFVSGRLSWQEYIQQSGS